MKKSIIFDLDGTLWDTTKQIEIVWKSISKKYKLKIDKNKIKEIMGLNKQEIVSMLFYSNLELGYKFMNECQNAENKYLSLNGGKIYKNTKSTIMKLYKKFDLYIVSNCQKGYIETFLKYYNLQKYFKDFECSGNTNKSKEENIKLLMNRNNITESIYIGDTQNDYKSAIGSNNKFIWAKYGFGVCKEYDYCINDISELLIVL